MLAQRILSGNGVHGFFSSQCTIPLNAAQSYIDMAALQCGFCSFSAPGFTLARPASKRHSEFQSAPPTEAGGDPRRLRANIEGVSDPYKGDTPLVRKAKVTHLISVPICCRCTPRTNGFVERMNRTLLDECFRIKGRSILYNTPEEIQCNLDEYLPYYNLKRSHQGYRLKGRTPAQALRESVTQT